MVLSLYYNTKYKAGKEKTKGTSGRLETYWSQTKPIAQSHIESVK